MKRRDQILEELGEIRLAIEVALARRDELIVRAKNADVPGPAIGEAAGISRARVSQIVKASKPRGES